MFRPTAQQIESESRHAWRRALNGVAWLDPRLTTTLAIVWVSLAGMSCSIQHASDSLRLDEQWAIPIDGSANGIRNTTAVEPLGQRLALLDVISRRIHLVRVDGVYVRSLPLPRLPDGSTPTSMSSLDGDRLLLGAYMSSRCLIVEMTEGSRDQPCEFPSDLRRIMDLLPYDGGVIALARRGESTRPIHLLRLNGAQLELTKSIGTIPPVALGMDSTRLLHGVGRAAIGEQLIHTQPNPLVLELLSLGGQHQGSIVPTTQLKPLEAFRIPDGFGGFVVGPLYSHVTGVQVWNGVLAVSAYSPSSDVSTLWLFGLAGEELGRLQVPFRMAIRAAVGPLLIAERHINGLEIVAYARVSDTPVAVGNPAQEEKR